MVVASLPAARRAGSVRRLTLFRELTPAEIAGQAFARCRAPAARAARARRRRRLSTRRASVLYRRACRRMWQPCAASALRRWMMEMLFAARSHTQLAFPRHRASAWRCGAGRGGGAPTIFRRRQHLRCFAINAREPAFLHRLSRTSFRTVGAAADRGFNASGFIHRWN